MKSPQEIITIEQKVEMFDKIKAMVVEHITPDEIPVLIGTLNTAQGVNGFETAVAGYPVFEYRDRYVLYLKSVAPLNGEYFMVMVPYMKEMLKPAINFLKSK